ncbi:MAG: DNA polymerase II [Sulfolobales archaeon]
MTQVPHNYKAVDLEVFVLDISYEISGNTPVIIIWGVDRSSRRVLIRDGSFRPYFYIVAEEGFSDEEIISSIKKLSIPRSPIIEVSPEKKKYFGREVRVFKIKTVIPESVREYREKIAQLPFVREVLEADIRFAMRYSIDKDLTPSTWHLFRVVETPRSGVYRVDAEYELVDIIKRNTSNIPPPLRIIALDIEVYNPRGSPRPDTDPVIIIALMNDREEIIQYTADSKNDSGIIARFIDYVLKYDPDIIVGYNSSLFDIPYLMERSKRNKIQLDIGRRRGGEPRQSAYGHVSIPGRLHVDLYHFAEEISEIKIKSLDYVAEFFGVMKRSERVNINWYEIFKYWDDPGRREVLLRYSRDDIISTYKIAEKILPYAIQLSALTGLPLDQVGAASVGNRLEWYLMREAYKYGELVPNREERTYEPYRGAIVLEPKPGVHENIAVLDFSSMYPNIMIKYNIGPDTFVSDPLECERIECYETPGTSYLFRREPAGFYKKVLETLLKLRKSIREEMKKYPPDSIEYRILNERQKGVKVLANAAYGYMGWIGARWYFKQGAEAVTAWGRSIISNAIKIAESMGLHIIYGDTDSIFVNYDEKKIEEFIERISRELDLEIKIDKIYTRVFFTEAKKRYIGLTKEGFIDIVGFEAVRGDWTDLAKEVQEEVAEIVLKSGSVDKAVEYVRNVIRDLEERKIPIEKLVIWKTITKKLEEYEADAPHVKAAKILIAKGGRIAIGDKIGYVIIKGSGKVSDRAIPYIYADVRDIDTNYYIDHQIIPASLRVLGYFGVSEKTLRSFRGAKSLFDFTKKGSS